MMQNKMLPFVVIVATTCVASLPVGATVFTVDLIATSTTTVQPGESVSYDIVGELSGDPSLGLALWSVDLQSSYAISAGLPQASPGPDMGSFVQPDGFTNPAGYGGTPVGLDQLLQIGGGQNTIGNVGPNPPSPIGQVVLGIASSPVVLATGLVNLPEIPGQYQISLSNLIANVITSGTGGPPPEVYDTEEATPVVGSGQIDIIVLPEPATLTLLALGGFLATRRR
jgi:hypothetical protein